MGKIIFWFKLNLHAPWRGNDEAEEKHKRASAKSGEWNGDVENLTFKNITRKPQVGAGWGQTMGTLSACFHLLNTRIDLEPRLSASISCTHFLGVELACGSDLIAPSVESPRYW